MCTYWAGWSFAIANITDGMHFLSQLSFRVVLQDIAPLPHNDRNLQIIPQGARVGVGTAKYRPATRQVQVAPHTSGGLLSLLKSPTNTESGVSTV